VFFIQVLVQTRVYHQVQKFRATVLNCNAVMGRTSYEKVGLWKCRIMKVPFVLLTHKIDDHDIYDDGSGWAQRHPTSPGTRRFRTQNCLQIDPRFADVGGGGDCVLYDIFDGSCNLWNIHRKQRLTVFVRCKALFSYVRSRFSLQNRLHILCMSLYGAMFVEPIIAVLRIAWHAYLMLVGWINVLNCGPNVDILLLQVGLV
jgi:hypothetical protein